MNIPGIGQFNPNQFVRPQNQVGPAAQQAPGQPQQVGPVDKSNISKEAREAGGAQGQHAPLELITGP